MRAWGGPSDPGFLGGKCKADARCLWPTSEHGIYVDQEDNVWLSGNAADTGKRIQEFLRYGSSGCSGTGSPTVGGVATAQYPRLLGITVVIGNHQRCMKAQNRV